MFLDEPTAGLDPIGAAAFDELTKSLQKTLGLTVFLITHDLDSLYAICDRVAVIADKHVIAVGTIPELIALDHPWIEEYFQGSAGPCRGRHAGSAGGDRRGGPATPDRNKDEPDRRSRPAREDRHRPGKDDALMETRSNHVLVGTVVLILLAVLALFTVWIARLGGASTKEYDIFFKTSVDGLAKGSAVTFSGVPSGQVKEIALWKPDPQFVRVRINVNQDTPILQGTTATISGVGFTGVSQISLDGARKGAEAIGCPDENPQSQCPYGVPVIPTKQGGLGAILNSAPQLLERLSTLTERLTGLLTDKNQASIAGILANTNRLTDCARRSRAGDRGDAGADPDRDPAGGRGRAADRHAGADVERRADRRYQAGDDQPEPGDPVRQEERGYVERCGRGCAAGAAILLQADPFPRLASSSVISGSWPPRCPRSPKRSTSRARAR